MHRRRKIDPRHAVTMWSAMVLIMVLLPYICTRLFPSLKNPPPTELYDGNIPETIEVYITADKKTKEFPLKNTYREL